MRRAMAVLLLVGGCEARAPAAPPAARAEAEPFCTRTLGLAQCFTTPALLPDHPHSLGDTPDRPDQPPTPWWKKIVNHWND